MELRDRACHDYRVGVKNFIDFAWEKVSKDGKMICPCRKCNNARRDTKSEIEFHLVRYGIVRNYTTWYNHGERLTSKHNEVDEENEELVDHEINELLEDAFGMSTISNGMYDDLDEQNEEQEPTGEALKFYKLLEDSKQSLYPGCQTFSKLSFIITLLHIKCLNGWSNKSFTMLLKLLIKAFPLPNSFPASYRKAKSVVQDLGLDYQKIDACPNDCMLFRGIHENAENCTTCGASRWKHGDTEKKRKVAMKTLRYFPLIPRLQRLFMCSKIAKQMTWHQWGRVNDGLMRHPADSEAWKELDRCHPQFAFDHRNVRLGLATDGFNHLAHEAKIAGPVQYRWNCFVERNLRNLKSYVRNRSRPEGSICEGCLVEECLTFCSRYLHDVETRFNRAGRNEDNGNMAVQPKLSIFQSIVRSLGKPKIRRVSSDEYKQARLYILQNCVEVIPYLQEHRQLVANEGVHKKEFFHWFDKKISDMHKANPEGVSDELLALAHGPDPHVKCFSGAIINGFRFHTKDCEAQRKTQNSGIKVAGGIINDGTSSTRSGIVDFYGVLTRIMQLQYAGRYPIFLFKCDWWDVFNEGVGYVKDNYGYISLNFAKMLKTDEPFVLVTQATQVFYVKDNLRIGWNIVVDSPPHDYYNMPVETCRNELLLDDEEPMKEDCFVDFERENSV